MTTNHNREKLQEIRQVLRQNIEINKGYFGLLFWQLQEVNQRMGIDELGQQASSLTLDQPDDEQLASLLGVYINIWDSAQDFNAASRFLASSLDMSADELLQAKIIYEEAQKEGE